MQTKFYSIIVVTLNAGEKLADTLESIANQSFRDYEVIIKDGGSTDHSVEIAQNSDSFKKLSQVKVIEKKDRGIYDGMNQALEAREGRFVQFLNCGDTYYSNTVLEETAFFISKYKNNRDVPCIFYGDQYNLLQSSVVTSVPKINDFACFRNVPCHQVCFYDTKLFEKRAYRTQYTVRADYEHFLYCIYEEKADAVHMALTVCNYEGGGYSETPENRKKSKEQHREITDDYLGGKAAFYRCVMFLTMAGLRTKLAESKTFSGIYNRLKSFFYACKR